MHCHIFQKGTFMTSKKFSKIISRSTRFWKKNKTPFWVSLHQRQHYPFLTSEQLKTRKKYISLSSHINNNKKILYLPWINFENISKAILVAKHGEPKKKMAKIKSKRLKNAVRPDKILKKISYTKIFFLFLRKGFQS